jgi:chromate transport protein ChrA
VPSPQAAGRRYPGSPLEVLAAFLKLGLSSFAGPIAHIGYFRAEFVERRRWVDEQSYADPVALCQFLPGPTSSQVGFSLGLLRAGPLGALAAWTGFTLTSAAALVTFAYGVRALSGVIGSDLLHGLQLVAVAIVAQAVWGMARAYVPIANAPPFPGALELRRSRLSFAVGRIASAEQPRALAGTCVVRCALSLRRVGVRGRPCPCYRCCARRW